MCSINPKHQRHFTLSVYTSEALTQDQWDDLVMQRVTDMERELNFSGKLRWIVSEAPPEEKK